MSKGQVFQRMSQWWITYRGRHQGHTVEHQEPAGPSAAEAYRLLHQHLRELGYGKEGKDAR
jgi:hypothetical protein